MKGGPGLQKKHKPWNSAMPAWEDVLTEKSSLGSHSLYYE